MTQETITKAKVTRHYGHADIYIGIGNVSISALFSISAIGKHFDYRHLETYDLFFFFGNAQKRTCGHIWVNEGNNITDINMQGGLIVFAV